MKRRSATIRPTKRIGTCYHPGDGSVFGRVRVRTPARTHPQELFSRHHARLEHLARFLSKQNGFFQFRRPRQSHVLVLGVESNRASQTAVVVDGQGGHRARVTGRRGDTPGLWWKGGADSLPPADSPISIWRRSRRFDPQEVERDRLSPYRRSMQLRSGRDLKPLPVCKLGI